MSEPLVALVKELGYDVLYRSLGWVECMLVRDDERWIGRGRDEAEALGDAIRQACPSHLAREVLGRAMRAENVTPPPPVSVEAPPMAVEVPPPPRAAARTREDALAEIGVLLSKIAADEVDLAMCAPQRQRLVLLAWIARARAIQDELLGDDDVNDAVTEVARVAGRLSRKWWPGSVPALQQAAMPEDSGRVLPDDDEYEPSTWSEVAARAERAVRAIEDADASRGCDEYGWADAALCGRQARSGEMLASVAGEVSEIDPDGMTGNDVDRLVRLAQRLRALRTSASDAGAWSGAMGRLRRCAARDRVVFRDLARVLDPAFVPPRPWAAHAGAEVARAAEIDPIARAAEVEAVVAASPRVGDRDAVRAWLLRALPLTDTHHDRIADVMRPHADAIVTFGPEDFAGAGRRIHRRLRKLQETLAGSAPTSAPPSEISLPRLPAAEDERPQHVVARTRGRRAVFVTNRTDPDLQVRLQDVCEFSALDWVESAPRAIEAVASAIANKKYDVVIAATGFLDHPVDTKLSIACRGVGVPYVRANRGRVAACMRALERDLAD